MGRKIFFLSCLILFNFGSENLDSEVSWSFVGCEGWKGEGFSQVRVSLDHGSPVFFKNLGDAGKSGVKCDGQDWSAGFVLISRYSFNGLTSRYFSSLFNGCINKGILVVSRQEKFFQF